MQPSPSNERSPQIGGEGVHPSGNEPGLSQERIAQLRQAELTRRREAVLQTIHDHWVNDPRFPTGLFTGIDDNRALFRTIHAAIREGLITEQDLPTGVLLLYVDDQREVLAAEIGQSLAPLSEAWRPVMPKKLKGKGKPKGKGKGGY